MRIVLSLRQIKITGPRLQHIRPKTPWNWWKSGRHWWSTMLARSCPTYRVVGRITSLRTSIRCARIWRKTSSIDVFAFEPCGGSHVIVGSSWTNLTSCIAINGFVAKCTKGARCLPRSSGNIAIWTLFTNSSCNCPCTSRTRIWAWIGIDIVDIRLDTAYN